MSEGLGVKQSEARGVMAIAEAKLELALQAFNAEFVRNGSVLQFC